MTKTHNELFHLTFPRCALTQKEAAKIFGINQPKVSALKNGRLKGFSIERLFSFLEALDQHIDIRITHKSKAKAEQGINVAYV